MVADSLTGVGDPGDPEVVPILLSWSSGKDSAWALHILRQDPAIRIVALITTVNEAHGRVAMHAVRRQLLHEQAESIDLPLIEVPIQWPSSNTAYEQATTLALSTTAGELGVSHIAFGDLFLEDVRAYRERLYQGIGYTCLFPIWRRPTARLAREMLAAGLRARITCVDPRQLDPAWVGAEYDEHFLEHLPASVDPCGENGEFHTFAYAGPMFPRALVVQPGPTVARDGFVFADLLPAGVGR